MWVLVFTWEGYSSCKSYQRMWCFIVYLRWNLHGSYGLLTNCTDLEMMNLVIFAGSVIWQWSTAWTSSASLTPWTTCPTSSLAWMLWEMQVRGAFCRPVLPSWLHVGAGVCFAECLWSFRAVAPCIWCDRNKNQPSMVMWGQDVPAGYSFNRSKLLHRSQPWSSPQYKIAKGWDNHVLRVCEHLNAAWFVWPSVLLRRVFGLGLGLQVPAHNILRVLWRLDPMSWEFCGGFTLYPGCYVEVYHHIQCFVEVWPHIQSSLEVWPNIP